MENHKLEKLKLFSSMYGSLLVEKNKTIIFMIQLFIALLVIASFSDKIIPASGLTNLKILIIFLLSLIPIMLVDYTLQINEGLNSLHEACEFKIKKKKWCMELINGSNYIYTLITIIVIDIIIQFINQNFQISLLIFLIQILVIAIIIFSKRNNKKE